MKSCATVEAFHDFENKKPRSALAGTRKKFLMYKKARVTSYKGSKNDNMRNQLYLLQSAKLKNLKFCLLYGKSHFLKNLSSETAIKVASE